MITAFLWLGDEMERLAIFCEGAKASITFAAASIDTRVDVNFILGCLFCRIEQRKQWK
jgi:hypothetical protein